MLLTAVNTRTDFTEKVFLTRATPCAHPHIRFFSRNTYDGADKTKAQKDSHAAALRASNPCTQMGPALKHDLKAALSPAVLHMVSSY